MRRGHRRLPVAAFLQLPVPGDDEGAPRRAIDAGGERGADGDGQAVAERAGVGLDAGQLVAIRVAVQPRQRRHEGVELGLGKEAGGGERGVEDRRAVALAEDAAIAIGRGRLLRVEAQDREVEHRQQVRRRQVAAGVADAGAMDHAETAAPQRVRGDAEVFGRRGSDGHGGAMNHTRSIGAAMWGANLS